MISAPPLAGRSVQCHRPAVARSQLERLGNRAVHCLRVMFHLRDDNRSGHTRDRFAVGRHNQRGGNVDER